MRALVLALLAAVLTSACATAPLQPASNPQSLCCLDFENGTQEAVTFHALPGAVRTSADARLRERAGAFYPRFAFESAEFWRVDGQAPFYAIAYVFSDLRAGIASYRTTIRLTADGRVVDAFDLPDFAGSPDKMRFVTPAQVEAAARAEGRNIHWVEPRLAYAADADAIVWMLTEKRDPRRRQAEARTLAISAHTAEVVWRGSSLLLH